LQVLHILTLRVVVVLLEEVGMLIKRVIEEETSRCRTVENAIGRVVVVVMITDVEV
jgi:regulator of extracellular matrix RemA (YlzA/DUF370 family)